MLYHSDPRAPMNTIAMRNANANRGVANTTPKELNDPAAIPRTIARPMPIRFASRFAVTAPRIPPIPPIPPMVPIPTSSRPRIRTAYSVKRANRAPEKRFAVPVQPAIDQSRRSRNTTRALSNLRRNGSSFRYSRHRFRRCDAGHESCGAEEGESISHDCERIADGLAGKTCEDWPGNLCRRVARFEFAVSFDDLSSRNQSGEVRLI